MDVREVRTPAEWDRCEEDWRRIAETSPHATVFQTWEWARAWWQHFGGRRRLWVLRFAQNGDTLGFAPLFLPPPGAPLRVARFIGTGGSDYLDLLAAPGHEADVSRAFRAFLGTRVGDWDWADLQQVRPEAAIAQEAGDGAGPVRVARWPGETCPFLALPADWEAFRKGLGKKLRGNIGYYERAAEKLYAVHGRLATAETLEADLEAFFELHQRRWNRRWLPGAFAARAARGFHADVAGRLLSRGWLRLHTLSLDGTVQAALYCFQFGGRCAYYLGGFEPEHARLSLGTILTARAIRHAIEADGAREFDFLRGDEPYKYGWGAQDRFNQRISVTRAGVRSRVMEASGRTMLRAEMALKGWMHRRHGARPAVKRGD